MSLFLECPGVPESMDAFIAGIRAELQERGTPPDWLGEAFENRLREAADRGAPLNVPLVEGLPPEPPRDGYIEWADDFFIHGFVIDEKTGAVDYRKHAARTTVRPGQLLATIIPPEPGKDGCNVFGVRIHAVVGKKARIRAGANVRADETGTRFYATVDGRIRWIGGTLSVDEVLTIEGNVGLATGDIEHPGAVVVMGDIEPGALVAAAGDIEVCGLVEQAGIEAGGNLLVHGGISGRGKRPVRAAGRVHARFVIDAEIEAGKDVVIEREILQSHVRTCGGVAVPYGRLVGGETVALTGVIAGKTGSEALVPTTIVGGCDFRLDDRIASVVRELTEHQTELARIREALKPLLRRRTLSTEAATRREDLKREREIIEGRVTGAEQILERLRAESRTHTRPRLEVLRLAHPETVFGIGPDHRLRLKDDASGPVHALLLGSEIVLRPGRAD